MKITKTIERVSKTTLLVIGLLMIYWLLLKLTGHSPSKDDIMLGMLSFISVGIIMIYGSLSDLKGRFEEHAKNSDKRFEALATDFKAHQIKKNH